jgi:hypothetical protein
MRKGVSKLSFTSSTSMVRSPESPLPTMIDVFPIGPGSFFKAHKDTPRGKDMFGSLAVVLPTKHTGGALHLRHDGKSFIHDCSNKFSSSSPQVVWVAFYSDVEHEVSKVEQGHRVTLTYNLYFVDGAVTPAIPRDISTSNAFFQAFSTVLADPVLTEERSVLASVTRTLSHKEINALSKHRTAPQGQRHDALCDCSAPWVAARPQNRLRQ